MKCKFLLDDVLLICIAGQSSYAPTDFQAHEYCRKIEHLKCPFYLGSLKHEHDMAEQMHIAGDAKQRRGRW